MPSAYSSIALVGAGNLGKFFIDALAASGVSFIVLTRPSSQGTKVVPPGAKLVPVELDDVEGLIKTFRDNKVDAVISTLGFAGYASETLVADAAKAAGVKIFVLSDFGAVTIGSPAPSHQVKVVHAQHLASIGLPSIRIFNGVFMSWLPVTAGYAVNQKVSFVDNAVTKGSTTAEEDIAGFTVHVLTHLPPSELENKVFRIQGDSVSMTQLAEAFGTTVTKVDEIPGDESWGGFLTFLATIWSKGAASTGWDFAESKELYAPDRDNSLWEGHKWKKVLEAFVN